MATAMQKFLKIKGEIIRPVVLSAQEQSIKQHVMNQRGKLQASKIQNIRLTENTPLAWSSKLVQSGQKTLTALKS